MIASRIFAVSLMGVSSALALKCWEGYFYCYDSLPAEDKKNVGWAINHHWNWLQKEGYSRVVQLPNDIDDPSRYLYYCGGPDEEGNPAVVVDSHCGGVCTRGFLGLKNDYCTESQAEKQLIRAKKVEDLRYFYDNGWQRPEDWWFTKFEFDE